MNKTKTKLIKMNYNELRHIKFQRRYGVDTMRHRIGVGYIKHNNDSRYLFLLVGNEQYIAIPNKDDIGHAWLVKEAINGGHWCGYGIIQRNGYDVLFNIKEKSYLAEERLRKTKEEAPDFYIYEHNALQLTKDTDDLLGR